MPFKDYSSLVISSGSNAVKYSSYFRSLGTEISFLILDQSRNLQFDSFNDHRMFSNGEMFYLNLQDNKIAAHEKAFLQTKKFTDHLKKYFFPTKDKIKRAKSEAVFSILNFSESVQFFDKNDVIDLKFNKTNKNIQLEIKNKGLIAFDHLFVEETDSALNFLKQKDPKLVKEVHFSDLVWSCYSYTLSKEFTYQDFWFLENIQYQSIFDNCFYIQSHQRKMDVWCLVPEHQFLNQQFHQDFQSRIKNKIENQFSFMSLSFNEVSENNVHLMNSQKLSIVKSPRITGFPSFSFFSQDNAFDWFSAAFKEFNKKHKIKNNLHEGSL